jgi:hypothetical protein
MLGQLDEYGLPGPLHRHTLPPAHNLTHQFYDRNSARDQGGHRFRILHDQHSGHLLPLQLFTI